MLLGWIITFSILGSVGAIAGAALLLLFPESTRKTLLPCLLSYATGTLLGAAFLGMIPHGLQQATPLAISGTGSTPSNWHNIDIQATWSDVGRYWNHRPF